MYNKCCFPFVKPKCVVSYINGDKLCPGGESTSVSERP